MFLRTHATYIHSNEHLKLKQNFLTVLKMSQFLSSVLKRERSSKKRLLIQDYFFVKVFIAVKTNLVAFGGHEIKLIVNDAAKSTRKCYVGVSSIICYTLVIV